MPWKKRSLRSANLYLVLDTQVNGYERLFEILKAVVGGGVDMVQLRDKHGLAKDVLKFSKKVHRYLKNRIPYIINDRVDLAWAGGASGVHLGQDDLPLTMARRILGPSALVGVSCQTLQQAQKAEQEGADYIGFGSVFKTLTKPERDPMDLRRLASVFTVIKIPVFAIGGINLDNVSMIRRLGINRIAVCRGICEVGNIRETTKAFKKVMTTISHQSSAISRQLSAD